MAGHDLPVSLAYHDRRAEAEAFDALCHSSDGGSVVARVRLVDFHLRGLLRHVLAPLCRRAQSRRGDITRLCPREKPRPLATVVRLCRLDCLARQSVAMGWVTTRERRCEELEVEGKRVHRD